MEETGFLIATLFEVTGHIYSEYSKLAISAAHSGNGIALLLYKTVDAFCRQNNVKYVFSIVPSKQARLYGMAFQKYQALSGESKYTITKTVLIPESIKQKYNGLAEQLTVVSIQE